MVYYNGAHSITFIDPGSTGSDLQITWDSYYGVNTWKDFGLIPTSKPIVNPPSFTQNFLQIPGRDGDIESVSQFFGKPRYSNRNGSFEFILVDNNLDQFKKYRSWVSTYSYLIALFSRKKMYMILDDDKDFYYEGVFYIDSLKSDQSKSTIVINYSLYPYKWRVFSTKNNWLWDPFNFETGIIYIKNSGEEYAHDIYDFNFEVGPDGNIITDPEDFWYIDFENTSSSGILKIIVNVSGDFYDEDIDFYINTNEDELLGQYNVEYYLKKGENVFTIYKNVALNQYGSFNSSGSIIYSTRIFFELRNNSKEKKYNGKINVEIREGIL